MNKSLRTASILGMALSALLFMGGCEDSTSEGVVNGVGASGSSYNGGSGHDSIQVKQTDDQTLVFKWGKNFNGYSRATVSEEDTGYNENTLLSQNGTGSYELTCKITSSDNYEAHTECTSTGDDYLVPAYSIMGTLQTDQMYVIKIYEGTSLTEYDTGIRFYSNNNSFLLVTDTTF